MLYTSYTSVITFLLLEKDFSTAYVVYFAHKSFKTFMFISRRFYSHQVKVQVSPWKDWFQLEYIFWLIWSWKPWAFKEPYNEFSWTLLLFVLFFPSHQQTPPIKFLHFTCSAFRKNHYYWCLMLCTNLPNLAVFTFLWWSRHRTAYTCFLDHVICTVRSSVTTYVTFTWLFFFLLSIFFSFGFYIFRVGCFILLFSFIWDFFYSP